MKITRDNYEIWFLDYLEGRLNEMKTEELQIFLANHPDLAEELEFFVPAISADSSIVYPHKESLIKDLYNDQAYFEDTAVAAIEGDLNEEDTLSLKNWLTKNPEKQGLLMLLERTRMKPDLGIIFPAKGRLKKKKSTTALWIRISAAAAIILFALSLFYPAKMERRSTKQGTEVVIIDQQHNSDTKNYKDSKSVIIATKESKSLKGQTSTIHQQRKSGMALSVQTSSQSRQIEHIETLKSKSCQVSSTDPVFNDLSPIKINTPLYVVNNEIPVSEFLNSKLQDLKVNGPKGLITREELALAGLHLFSRLPGKHLTGRKGTDGRLKMISLNTPLLAVSLPVNR